MNKLKLFIFLSTIFIFNINSVFALPSTSKNVEKLSVVDINAEKFDLEEDDVIKRVSLRDKFKRSPEVQVQNFFKKFNRYSETNNVKKLKEMYSDSFVNNDGLDKETVFKLNEDASSSYQNIDYSTELLSIKANEFYAVVEAIEKAKGETVQPFGQIEGLGEISSELHYIDYLRKEDGKWKIIATDIKSEKLYLNYGEAKARKLEIFAPTCVPANTEYEVTFKTDPSLNELIVGSITNEEIKYPQSQVKDVLKRVKDGTLSRVIKSNSNNHNEYATVSVAMTKAVVEPGAVVVKMTGASILMSRVNVLKAKNSIKDIKVEENKNGKKS